MKRLFWIGVGVGATVLAIRKYRELAERYSPPAVVARAADGVQERAGDLGRRLRSGAEGFPGDFRAAMDLREEQLRAALLARGQATPEQTRARRAAGDFSAGSPDPSFPGRGRDREVDTDLPYSF